MDSAPVAGWLRWALALLALSLLLFSLPSRLEGPVLLPISPGHAIATLDALAIVPLLLASGLVYRGVWRARARLLGMVGRSPSMALTVGFGFGLGLGLLLASVYSGFFWWWAVGAVLLTIGIVLVGGLAATG